MKYRALRTCMAYGVLSIFSFVCAAVNISPGPIWQADYGNIPTGAGWGDIDGDGWIDLIVTNGCDYAFRPNHVYLNVGGAISTLPGWISTDQDPSDNVAIADLDHDGDLDLVVAQLGYTPWGCPPLPHVAYYNDGGLSTTPTWYSQPGNSFSCSIGDPDGDGDHDVAFAQGDHLTGSMQNVVIYRNNNGTIENLPYWESDSIYYSVEAAFIDIDQDGDHDLAIGGRNIHVAIFYNNAGSLETSPSWQTHTIVGARQMDFGDFDGDGDADLAVAGIDEGFFLFENLGGVLDTIPCWSCSEYTQPSCVAWGDVDDDGDLDLAAGAWLDPVGVFENNNGTLSSSYVWSYGNGGFLQQVAWGDFDEDGLVNTTHTFIGDGTEKLFYLPRKPIHEITAININGAPVPIHQYCYELAQGWISLASPLVLDDTLTVHYSYSRDLDLAVTGSRAMLFENQHITGITQGRPVPINDCYTGPTIIAGQMPLPVSEKTELYDIAGREAHLGQMEPGIYFLRLETGSIKKIVKVR
jgi:hypothetical protein